MIQNAMRTTPRDRQIVKAAFPEFKGRKISIDFSGTVTFWDTNWSGGTRSYFKAIHLSTGKTQGLAIPAPWINVIEGKGCAVVELRHFCGQPPTARVYFSNQGALPAPSLAAGQ